MASNADLQFTNGNNAAANLPTLAGYAQPSLQPYNADTAMYPAINSLAAAAAAYYNASLPASGSQYQQLPGLWPLAGSEPSVAQNVHSNSTAGAGANGPASTAGAATGSSNAPNASPNGAGAGVNAANSNSLLYLHGPSAWNPYYAQRSIVNYAAEYSANRRKNATRETTSTLKAWLQEHIKNPYPSKGEKIMLAIITKMTLTQVSTWFANARRRLKKENKMQWSPRQSNEDDDSQPAPAPAPAPPPAPAQVAQPEAKQAKLDNACVKPAANKLATCKDGSEDVNVNVNVNGLSKIWSLAQAASDAKDTQSQLLGFSAANFQAGFSSSSRDALHSLQSLSFGSLPNSSSWSCAMQTAMNASGEGNFGMFKLD